MALAVGWLGRQRRQADSALALSDQSGGCHSGIRPRCGCGLWLDSSVVHFFDSGTFWAAAGVLVAFVTLFVIYRAAAPRRTLIYGIPTVTPLLSGIEGADMKVLHKGKPLTNRHLIEVTLFLASRADIRSTDFDSGQPLILEIGAQIVTIMGPTRSPGRFRFP
jgi:hypothetical protein